MNQHRKSKSSWECMPTNCDMCAPSKGDIFDGIANNCYSDILNQSNLLSLEIGLSPKKYPKIEYIRCILNRIRNSQFSKEEWLKEACKPSALPGLCNWIGFQKVHGRVTIYLPLLNMIHAKPKCSYTLIIWPAIWWKKSSEDYKSIAWFFEW